MTSPTQGTCSFLFTPQLAGTQMVGATYPGDAIHDSSQDTEALQVTQPGTGPSDAPRGEEEVQAQEAQALRVCGQEEVQEEGEPALTPLGGALNQSFGRAILRWSSASSRIFSSTPISFATSRIERFEAAASLTISPALS